jgi:hypothetical protein
MRQGGRRKRRRKRKSRKKKKRRKKKQMRRHLPLVSITVTHHFSLFLPLMFAAAKPAVDIKKVSHFFLSFILILKGQSRQEGLLLNFSLQSILTRKSLPHLLLLQSRLPALPSHLSLVLLLMLVRLSELQW